MPNPTEQFFVGSKLIAELELLSHAHTKPTYISWNLF